MISMIAAIGAKNELGEGDKLIWKIPDDMKRFKEKTLGHPIIMGRKTYESIGRVLPNRANIIISRDENYKVEGAIAVQSIEQAIEKANEIEESRFRQGSSEPKEVFIIGGAQIYTLGIKFAEKLYLTKINSEAPMADAFFPNYSEFTKVTFSEKHNDDGLEYEFVNLEK